MLVDLRQVVRKVAIDPDRLNNQRLSAESDTYVKYHISAVVICPLLPLANKLGVSNYYHHSHQSALKSATDK